MNYIDEDRGFEEWCESNYLPIHSQAIWKKLFKRFNRSGWSEWITIDNRTLMAEVQIRSESKFIELRDKLIEAELIEYIKGKKSSPNKYKLLSLSKKYTSASEVQSEVYTEVKNEVYTEAQTSDINKLNKTREDTYGDLQPPSASDGSKIPSKELEPFFESIWKPYPRKQGKGKISKAKKEALYKIGYDEMLRCMNRYKRYIADNNIESQYIQQGSTFFNSGYVDYLDKEYLQGNSSKIIPPSDNPDDWRGF